MRFAPTLLVACSSLSLLVAATTNDARACGGCFHPPPTTTQSPTVVTDHRMVVALSGDTTTLWDQIQYAGDPADFAWILPVHGGVAVGVGDGAFIDALDQKTTPVIHAPQTVCQYPNYAYGGYGDDERSSGGCLCIGMGSGDSAGSATPNAGEQGAVDGGKEGVTVTTQETVGPYDVVEIHGTDTTTIIDWLTTHSYVIPPEIKPILDQYVKEGFDFVAVRLAPGAGVQAMRPIRVSWKGKDVSLPLRMVAAGVGDKVGIKLFVIGDGRWTIGNFYTFTLDDAALSWDFTAQRSDYTSQRDSISSAHGYAAFALETSTEVVANSLPRGQTPPSFDAGPSDASSDTGAPDIPASESDVDVAFGTIPARRVTRLRGDIAASALSSDILLQADTVQLERPVDYNLTKFTNGDAQCPGGTMTLVGAPNPYADGGAPGSMLKLDATGGCSTGGSTSPWRWSLLVAFGAVAASIGRRLTKR